MTDIEKVRKKLALIDSFVRELRVLARPGDAPVTLDIVHVDLYFFYDVDVVLLNVEVAANDLTLAQAQEQLYRFGRGYPAGWDAQGLALHTMASVEWLGAAGEVLASSDAQQRDAERHDGGAPDPLEEAGRGEPRQGRRQRAQHGRSSEQCNTHSENPAIAQAFPERGAGQQGHQ